MCHNRQYISQQLYTRETIFFNDVGTTSVVNDPLPEERELVDTILHYYVKTPIFEKQKTLEIEKEVLSAGKVPQKSGKGYRYPVSGHLKRLENSSGITHQTMLAIVGCCE